ncbi:MAG: heme biosynthesis HemY N-terminal domain-containing protein [Betaproteobacteria bacterium]|nr:heme biosynthesis protein HemY [Burkholderiales bacterium]
MRWSLWLLALFGIAVAVALGLSMQAGTVTLFVPPYRLDMSLNLVVIGLLSSFVLLYAALRGLFSMFELPVQARRWRAQQRERSAQQSLLNAMLLWMTGRFLRSRKAALQGLSQVDSLLDSGESPHQMSLTLMRSLLHLLAAESAHALRDQAARELHFQQVLVHDEGRRVSQTLELRDAAYLNAARWALNDRDSQKAQQWLAQLPQGTVRRTMALRLRLKADRMSLQHLPALDTARLLAKHGAFSASAAASLVRGLAMACLDDCHDSSQLQTSWKLLQAEERAMPELALHAAQCLLKVQGDPQIALQWLLPVWQALINNSETQLPVQRQRMVQVLSSALHAVEPDSEWLARIEQARLANPRSLELQYLSGMVCLRHGLWGKAQQMLEQVAPRLSGGELQRQAWRALAELAENKGDTAQALACWKLSAKV